VKNVIVIGSGLGSLSAAAILARHQYKVTVLEQNWIAGGCTTSYPRKGYVFETGATTLVGMENNMPVGFLFNYLNLDVPLRRLTTPMTVQLEGKLVVRHENLDDWITEAREHFGENQAAFWREAFKISQFVWSRSLKYLNFPPRTLDDYFHLLKKISINDFKPLQYAFLSTKHALKKFKVDTPEFVRFVDEQLMITAQNKSEEVNFLFGAAALCYTNYPNYYVDGGLKNLITPLIDYISAHNGTITYREPVLKIEPHHGRFKVTSKNDIYYADKIISGIPINNTIEILKKLEFNHSTIFDSQKLSSAFQMGLVFKKTKIFDCLHHQIHLDKPLPGIDSKSIFVSLSHPDDHQRTNEPDTVIASISTHWKDPQHSHHHIEGLEQAIIEILIDKGFFLESDLKYFHSSGPKSWNKWTGRSWGFVGGYPQYMKIKPWQMNKSRLYQKGIYQTGDTVYPGQGIPGVTLSGIIAAKKLIEDEGQSVGF
jgi:phytoene dehydrogenase-like protein